MAEKCEKCGVVADHQSDICIDSLVFEDGNLHKVDGEQCLINQLADRDKADAEMHKKLGFEGFDEDGTFHEAVELLLKEFGEARRALAEAREILANGLDRDKDPEDSLRTLAVCAVNGIYWRDKEIATAKAEAGGKGAGE